MKTIRRLLPLLALQLALCLAAAAPAAAQTAAERAARARMEELDRDYSFSEAQKKQVVAIFEKQQTDVAAARADTSLDKAARDKKIGAATAAAYKKLGTLFTPAQREINRRKAAAKKQADAALEAAKDPASWLVPGNGFEHLPPPALRWGETALHALPGGRIIAARGNHIAVSTDGMKTFPQENNLPFITAATPAEFAKMFSDGAGGSARLAVGASGAWLVIWRAPHTPRGLGQFWDKTAHNYVPHLTGGQICATRSTDGGKTWSPPARISDPRFTIGHPPRSILQAKSGVILIPAQYRTPNPGRHTVSILRSADDGLTWSAPAPAFDLPNSNGNHDGVVEPVLIQLNDGAVWFLTRTSLGALWESHSRDDGLTWTPLRPSVIQASSSPPTLERLSDGRLVLVWNPWRDSEGNPPETRGARDSTDASLALASWQRRELVIATSRDDGKTWGKPLVVARHPLKSGVSGWISYVSLFEYENHLYLSTGQGRLHARVPLDKLP